MRLYKLALHLLMFMTFRKLNIIVVGANDVKINDPITEFLTRNRQKINLLLIEPNVALIPILTNNCKAMFVDANVANCAVGQSGELTLYAIKQSRWSDYQPPYAEGWPIHRAPTGITSSSRKHVEQAITNAGIDPEGMIEELVVSCNNLLQICDNEGFPQEIHCLQIDTEGHDDIVLENSSLETTKPNIILFEISHLDETRIKRCRQSLQRLNYTLYELGDDILAIRRNASVKHFFFIVCISAANMLRRLKAAFS